MGMMRYMLASEGDVAYTWGETEVEGAKHLTDEQIRAEFSKIVAHGYSAVELAKGTTKGQLTTQTFDPTKVEEVVMIPNAVAG